MLKRAVVMTLVNIGELCTLFSEETRSTYAQIPWRPIKSTRNVIAHRYEQVDFIEIWNTAKVSIPELIEAINQIEKDLGEKFYCPKDCANNYESYLQVMDSADAIAINDEEEQARK